MADNLTVGFYNSTNPGCPSLTGEYGSLIGLLDACLLNGYGTITLDSLVVANNVATATKSTGHSFPSTFPALILIEGATPSGLNGLHRCTSTSTSTFTFTTSGISNQTATGTITAKRAPLGWSKPFTGTNNAVYRSSDLAGTQLYLRVNEATGDPRISYFTMYETMSAFDTGTNPSTVRQIGKSISTDATARPWRLYGDSRAFYLFVDRSSDNTWTCGGFFGDLVAYRSPDAYACAITGGGASDVVNKLSSLNLGIMEIARSAAQTGTLITGSNYSHYKTPSYLGSGGVDYPCPVDNNLHAWPVETWETLGPRGRMPGLLNPLHNTTLPHATFITALPDLNGGNVIVQMLNTNYRTVFLLDRDWR